MPRPKLADIPHRMSPEDVVTWLAEVRERGIATTDIEAGALIGKSHDTLRLMKLRGADQTTAMACAAALSRLPPFGGTEPAPEKRSFTVTLPLTVTVDAEGYDPSVVRSTLAGIFGAPKQQVKVSE